eukprot:CAMPEP_0178437902 /NCGR_PEP_ID=MMETSP0689_2-20121128/35266_1 /TAXON_ID=160604 /ORGANISM="Amphidinium massartii, Strain CS-259" /LENGTH=710 /DNA_ID=CAMNT_0020060187 /DNA_START=28 /DNA_END=2160 /DNA_ORIENTATION=-
MARSMKCVAVFVLVAATTCSTGQAARAVATPISRVVELLHSLSDKLEQELKTEEDMYEKYICWANTVINAKTASNKKAQARIDDLNTYIEDLDAGRVELTSEREDLTRELASLNAGLEEASAQRDQESKDFSDAEMELQQGIRALKEAISVLQSAAGEASFAQSSFGPNPQAVLRALALGAKVLNKGDLQFMHAVLTGEVPDGPEYDWKKLNRDATFKMKYKARSGEIVKVLQNLLTTFDTNLAEATAQENKAKVDYDRLSSAKTAQRDAAAAALARLDKENGARGLTKAEAQAEINALTTQVNDDKGYITQVSGAMDTKKTEWKDRKNLRMQEIEAMSKAIAILHSDDARDNFKRSFASQGFSLLQVGRLRKRSEAASQQVVNAAGVVKDVARKSGDKRLMALASRVAMTNEGHFDAVIEAIDKMVEALNKEEATDLSNKENCEQDRAQDTRDAVEAARDIDDKSSTITRLLSEISDIDEEIKDKNEQIEDIKEQMKEAGRIRADEHAEWQKSDAEDEEAADTVQQAMAVLTTFYRENGLALVGSKAKTHVAEPIEVTAGQAPPPPPPTWENPQYGGASGESQGVIAILDLLHQDIIKDRNTAKTAEDNAKTAYDNFVTTSNTDISTLTGAIGSLNTAKAGKEQTLGQTRDQRLTKKGELDAVLKKIEAANAGCSFVLVNYPVRVQNRQIEIDGLLKAKAILEGAVPVS